jgi:hypothetical protein
MPSEKKEPPEETAGTKGSSKFSHFSYTTPFGDTVPSRLQRLFGAARISPLVFSARRAADRIPLRSQIENTTASSGKAFLHDIISTGFLLSPPGFLPQNQRGGEKSGREFREKERKTGCAIVRTRRINCTLD